MKKFLIIIGCIVLYFVSIVPVGLFLYTLKMDLGIDMFSKTGVHSFGVCMYHESQKILNNE